MVIMNEIGGLERQRVYVSAMRTEVYYLSPVRPQRNA